MVKIALSENEVRELASRTRKPSGRELATVAFPLVGGLYASATDPDLDNSYMSAVRKYAPLGALGSGLTAAIGNAGILAYKKQGLPAVLTGAAMGGATGALRGAVGTGLAALIGTALRRRGMQRETKE